LEEIVRQNSLEESDACSRNEVRLEKWDGAVDSGGEQSASIRDHMVDVLNRRNYVRNLVRDVNEALESGS
jgi:hypothetical protein